MGNGAAGFGGLAVSFNAGGNGEIINPSDCVGPLTGHVMWTKPIQGGGVVGGQAGVSGTSIAGDTYFEGSAYSERYSNPIIVEGLLIYNPPVSYTGISSGPTTCVDLTTGQIKWQSNNACTGPNMPSTGPYPNGVGYVPAISFAYIYDVQDPNQHGVYPPILFTSNFAEAFDAYTGFWLFNVTGVPTATGFTRVTGPSGEQLRYTIINGGNSTNPSYTLAEWNSTKMWGWTGLSPAIDTTTVSRISGSMNYAYNQYYQPTYTSISTTTSVDGVATTQIINYTAIPTVVNASVWNPADTHCRFDWNVSIPWLNTMGASTLTTTSAGVVSHFAQGSNPVTILQCIWNDTMLCMNGTLPGQGATFMGSKVGHHTHTSQSA